MAAASQSGWEYRAVFSNGVGYPRTTFLLSGGAKEELAFKYFLRRHQVPTMLGVDQRAAAEASREEWTKRKGEGANDAGAPR